MNNNVTRVAHLGAKGKHF